MKYVFIENHRAEFSIKAMCRVLRVARSGWYVWLRRRHQMSLRQQFRLTCDAAVHKAFIEAKQRYGAPRLADEMWSRAVIGWSMSPRMTAQLACDALQMALWRRRRPECQRQ